MRLTEHQGKQLLKSSGIKIPAGILTDNKSYVNLSFHKEKYKEFFFEHSKVIIKAQVIGGKRKKQGLIEKADSYQDSLKIINEMYNKNYNNKPITSLLIEKQIQIKQEIFLAILYDGIERKPMILLSQKGGIDVEELNNKDNLTKFTISPKEGLHDYQARQIAYDAGFENNIALNISLILKKVYNCFTKYDCKSLEINPLILTNDNMLIAGDAKIVIDDSAIARQDIFHDITETEDASFMSARELEARKIDYNDHRGTAGKTFVELDGDIAILASGGGASLTAMDALIQAGGNPANYTEYSGNPPKEKVKRLTEITLDKENLNGCLVIGGKANFTDIYETLSGFMEVVIKLKPKYPIVIRRAGQRDKEAFEMIKKLAKEYSLDITLFGEETPMSKAAKIMAEKAKEYKLKKQQK
ncbi:MAG: ATP-grasp domain-containing protein [Candidatus Woesearchaeota archaeon]